MACSGDRQQNKGMNAESPVALLGRWRPGFGDPVMPDVRGGITGTVHRCLENAR